MTHINLFNFVLEHFVFIAKVAMGTVWRSQWFDDIWHLKYRVYAEMKLQWMSLKICWSAAFI